MIKYILLAILPSISFAYVPPTEGHQKGIDAAEAYISCVQGFHLVANERGSGGFITTIDETPNKSDTIQVGYKICKELVGRGLVK